MSSNFIPYDKLNKKQKKEYNKKKRKDWGEINPSTKVVPDTHKEKQRKEKEKSSMDF